MLDYYSCRQFRFIVAESTKESLLKTADNSFTLI